MATTTRDYLDYLDQEIGIAPANSQEELQAARTIADIFEAHDLQAKIQEFAAPASAKTTLGILRIVLFVGALLAGLAGVARVVGILLALAATALLLLDAFGNDVIRRYGPQAKSQNVIACHKATGPLVAKGNRPIVIVAHYDTPHEDLLQRIGFARYRPLLTRISAYCIPITAVLALMQALVFLPEGFRRFAWVLCLIAALPVLLIGVSIVSERFMPCTPGSNDNKASVAALLGVLESVRPKPEIQWAVPDETPSRAAATADDVAEADAGFAPVAVGDADSAELAGEGQFDTSFYDEAAEEAEEVVEQGPANARHGKEILESLGMLPATCEIAYVEAPPAPKAPKPRTPRRSGPVIAPATRRRRGVTEEERLAEAPVEEIPADDVVYEDEYVAEPGTYHAEFDDSLGDEEAAGGFAFEDIVDRVRTGIQSLFGGRADELYDADAEAEMFADEGAYAPEGEFVPAEGEAAPEGEFAPVEGELPVEGDVVSEGEPAFEGEAAPEGEVAPEAEFAAEAEPVPAEGEPFAENEFVTAEGGYVEGEFFDGEPYEGEVAYEDEGELPFRLPFKLPAFIERLFSPADPDEVFYEDDYPVEGEYADDSMFVPAEGEYIGEPTLAPAEGEFVPVEGELAGEEAPVEAEPAAADEPAAVVEAAPEPVAEPEVAPEPVAEAVVEAEPATEPEAEPEAVVEETVVAEPEQGDPLELVAEPAPAVDVAEAYRDFHVPATIMDFGADEIAAEEAAPAEPAPAEPEFLEPITIDEQPEFALRDGSFEPISLTPPDQDSITMPEPEAGSTLREAAYAEPAYDEAAYDAPAYDEQAYAEPAYDAYGADGEGYEVEVQTGGIGSALRDLGGLFKGAIDDMRYVMSIPADETPSPFRAPAAEAEYEPVADEVAAPEFEVAAEPVAEAYDEVVALEAEPTEEVVLAVEGEEPTLEAGSLVEVAAEPEVTAEVEAVVEAAPEVTAEVEPVRSFNLPEVDFAADETPDVSVEVTAEAEPIVVVADETIVADQDYRDAVDAAIIAEVGKMSSSEEEGTFGEIDTGGLHITGDEDFVDSDTPVDTTRPKPAAPEDPAWGVSSFTPAPANIARRAALFDLPDPSAEEIDPLGPVTKPDAQASSALDGTAPSAPVMEAPDTLDTFANLQAVSAEPDAETNMPVSTVRVSEVDTPDRKRFRLFGRKEQPSTSMSEWLGVDDDFDAKEEGRSIGSWEHFSDSIDSSDDSWKGGAAAAAQLRLVGEDDEGGMPSEQELREAILGMGDDELISHDIWFVALGASAADHAGIQAFLDEYRTACRGSFVINLDCVGSGELTILSSEGLATTRRADKRVSRLLSTTASDLHVPLVSAPYTWEDTDATPAMRKSMRSVTIAGLDESGCRAFSGSMDDVPENIIEEQVQDVADLVAEVIRRS